MPQTRHKTIGKNNYKWLINLQDESNPHNYIIMTFKIFNLTTNKNKNISA